VHICGTKIPYKGLGKESIADVPVIEREIEEGVRVVARSLKLYIMRKHKEEEAMRKAITVMKYIPEVTNAMAVFARSNPEPIDKNLLELKLFELVKARFGDVLKNISSPKDVVVPIE
jgi:DNA topoisomerase-6 subunit B